MDGNGLCKGLGEWGTDCEEKTCPVAGPFQDLYIYLLEGMVKKKEESYLGSAFIGNWVEEDTSFLFFSKPSADALSQLLKMRQGLEVIEDYHFAYEQWQGGSLMRSQYREIKAQLGRHDFHILREWDYDMTWFTMLVEKEKST